MSNLIHLGGGFFRWVLQTSWQAAVLAVLILVGQWLLRKRISPAWRYGLWLLLVLRLLMPVSPQSAFSIFNLTKTSAKQPITTIHAPILSEAVVSRPAENLSDIPVVPALRGAPLIAQVPVVDKTPVTKPVVKVDWFAVAFCGYLAGVCFFAARLVWTNGRFRSRIGGYQPIADENVTRLFNDCRAAFNISQPVRLIESEEVESPAVYGLWRKWLLLPDGVLERFSMAELRCVFLHELAHIKRRDLGVNWLVALLQVLHWFNPLLWVAWARMRADRELAADALALAHIHERDRAPYGETILKVLEGLTGERALPGLVGIAESKAQLKERLAAIGRASVYWKWPALGLVAVLAIIGLTDAQTSKPQSQQALSSPTLSVLHALTNQVTVILYYDRHADSYPDIVVLLNEYRAASKYISVDSVDYVRDPGQAEIIKEKYQKYFTAQADEDLVIFDCGGRVKVLPGAELFTYTTKLKGTHPSEANPQKPELEFERRPVAFNGERAFTSILLALANPQPLKAYYLQGHGEPSLADTGQLGYQKFASVLQQKYISVTNLYWIGNTGVPQDCNLLIIAGPARPLKEPELQQIGQYLREGGRLLLLFNFTSKGHPTGLETTLQSWGIGVLDDTAQDADHTITTHDIVVSTFNKHPVVDSLSQSQLQLYSPRPILKLPKSNQMANAPEVTELFATSAGGTLLGNRSEPPHNYPLACAVEQKLVAGVTNPRGNTRVIAVGDDIFLGNYYIDSGGNRDFLNAALNWLCDRSLLVAGIEPRPISADGRHELRQNSEKAVVGTNRAIDLAAGISLIGADTNRVDFSRTAHPVLDLNRAQEAQDLQFTASGVVDSQYYSEGNLSAHLTNDFICHVSKGKYSMFLTASVIETNFRSFECLFDGINTYFATRLSTNPVTTAFTMEQGKSIEHRLPEPLQPPNNDAILEITTGSMPSVANNAVVVVWLGLASIVDPGEALATSQVPLTYLGSVYRNKHIKLKVASKAHESIPNFLEWREDYHEGNMLSENHGSLQRTPFIGSLSLGYTNSTYRVVAWTNVMGLSFPEQAQLKIFLPSKDKTSVECQIIYSTRVSSIQLGSPDTRFRPMVVGAKTTVRDRRGEGDSASLTADEAKTLAIRLANEKASATWHRQPFHDGQPATFVSDRWVWYQLAPGDVEATVELAADGSTNSVAINILSETY